MLSVADVAQAAGVSQAAVRARLADGTLEGRQQMRGHRLVWSIDAGSAQRYVTGHGGTWPSGERPAAVTPHAPDETERDERALDVGAPAAAASWLAADPSSLDPATVLAENARLRAALSAMSRAHQALVDLVEVAFAGPAARP